jgi:TolA-binding protein
MMVNSRYLRWSLALLIAAAMGTGCAATSDVQQLAQNQQSLRQMIANDRQQMDQLQEEYARLNDRVTEMQHGGKLGTRSKQLASINARLNKIESAMNSLQGGSAAAAAGAPGAAGTPGATATPGSMASLGASATPPAAPPAASKSSSMPPVPGWQSVLGREMAAARNSSESGAGLYRAGLADMQAGKYQSAVGKFAAFQRLHPKSPLSEPAEYFSANALFELGAQNPANYNQAILQFNDLAMRYPSGRFAANAELREAQAFLRTNDPLDARLTLEKVVRDHPGTTEASAAHMMMKSMASN